MREDDAILLTLGGGGIARLGKSIRSEVGKAKGPVPLKVTIIIIKNSLYVTMLLLKTHFNQLYMDRSMVGAW